jgi:hypothetical protein
MAAEVPGWLSELLSERRGGRPAKGGEEVSQLRR